VLLRCFGAITANCMGGTQFLPAFPTPLFLLHFSLVCVLVFHLICCVLCVCVCVSVAGKRNKSIKVHTQKASTCSSVGFHFHAISSDVFFRFSALPFHPTHSLLFPAGLPFSANDCCINVVFVLPHVAWCSLSSIAIGVPVPHVV